MKETNWAEGVEHADQPQDKPTHRIMKMVFPCQVKQTGTHTVEVPLVSVPCDVPLVSLKAIEIIGKGLSDDDKDLLIDKIHEFAQREAFRMSIRIR